MDNPLNLLRLHCLQKIGVTEELPFDDDILAYKVLGKIFLLTSLRKPHRINVKCDPQQAIILREKHPEHILPGWHMNKKHWNTILLGSQFTLDQIYHWIDHSYQQVIRHFTKKQQYLLQQISPHIQS